MSDRFERLSRRLATSMPRRGALRLMAATGATAVAAALARPFRADGLPVCGGVPCGSACCENNTVCLNSATGACGCAAGNQACGPGCCSRNETCSDPQAACCCPKGATPCGPRCCAKGVACLDAGQGICGCQAGTTPCGTTASPTCCPAGTACTSGCPAPSNNTVSGRCYVPSDVHLKDNVVPVTWDH
jgi:hypothetical protein